MRENLSGETALPRSVNARMSQKNNIPWDEYLSEPLRELPELPVLRDSYCPKETVDRIARWVREHHPEWLMKLLLREGGNRAGHYLEISELLARIKKHAPEVIGHITPYLGDIDLMYEVSRRLRSAYGLFEILPCGKPLAPSPNGPFPPMPVVKISPHNEERGATQEMVDTVLADFYDQRPDLWFAAGEALQRRLGILVGTGDRHAILRKIILKRGFAEDIRRKYVQKGDLPSILHACKTEFPRRILVMTDISVEDLEP